ncbi:hypothetical protein N5079_19905 [Planotetraspora sp. A-T 1434]|uniref:hypothetical protein n=1 Tax=Planotetraspora sp. A-T 1434 TaxID=2979219 RepID=UPI0021BE06B8|nr:hypothetical protein [Planotetraspora sp. A-T 1434]MCT9932470.1 hypothetical protein [Planotetraspora sp. A-T 1434]
MGLFSSKMTDAQLAALKGKGQSSNDLRALAIAANGHEVNSSQKRRARQELERTVGKRKADKLQEDALRQAGARPKGVSRLFG